MAEKPEWTVGLNRCDQETDVHSKRDVPAVSSRTATTEHERQRVACLVFWDHSQINLALLEPVSSRCARARFQASLPDLIWNAAALEGNGYTLQEVRVLLEDNTAIGKRVEEAKQILALSDAYNRLGELLDNGTFVVNSDTAKELHSIVARHEAIDAGLFRGQGSASPSGGHVRLSRGGTVDGIYPGDSGEKLTDWFSSLTEHLEQYQDPRVRALAYFAAATRIQFFFDGNKRAARLMMTGILLSSGYDAVNIPFSWRLEFNNALDMMFSTDDATDLMVFLAKCSLK